MKLSFKLKRVCGSVLGNGNIIFTSDGNSVISPIGNRVTVFDLVHHTSYTLPIENRKDIRRVAVSHNGLFLITVDEDGHALFLNLPRRIVLQRFHFKRKVYDLKFSPDDKYFAVTFGRGCQIWKTPGIAKEFSPLTLCRNIGGHNDDTVCLDWSSDCKSLIMGSKDLSARIYYNVASKYMSLSVLSGHRDRLVGAFFAGEDNCTAYTIARDGAIFTWKYTVSDETVSTMSGGKNSKRKLPRNFKRSKKQNSNHGRERIDEPIGSESDSDSNSDDESISDQKKQGLWALAGREFLWEPNTEVSSAAFNKTTNLLVIGFNQGVFGLYEMPGCINLHRLSISQASVNTASINCTGEWICLGSSHLGQLVVWEWKSETYVLKQQGHLYGLNALDFSSDGHLIATGGEDGKVKLWNCASGFCFVTFTEHIAPVTGIKFVGAGAGKALLSSSLDGTVRAHDLLRYKNFKTLTAPTMVQFTSLATDASGEVVCAGSLDPFNIYVWSLQTGQLLDILSGHEGPIACMDFNKNGTVLASGSWDGTLKLWDVYQNKNIETMEHGCDVLAMAFRPDGKEVCTCATNGNIYFWDVESGEQVSFIEGRRDITGGRLTTDAMSAQNAARGKCFTSVTYSADGSFILAGGRSKYVCIYEVAGGTLVKKFQLSHNRSLEGILDELRSDRLVDGIAIDNLDAARDDNGIGGKPPSVKIAPGSNSSKLNDGSRTSRPEVITSALKFSPTGREWAVATTQGLQIFALDENILFAPTDLDIAITPQAISLALSRQEFQLAINMALHLGEKKVLKRAIDSVDSSSIELVVKSIDLRMLRDMMKFLADELVQSRHVEYYLKWVWEIIRCHGKVLQSDSMPYMESLRALIRSVNNYEKDIMRMGDANQFSLKFIKDQVLAIGNDNSVVEDVEDGSRVEDSEGIDQVDEGAVLEEAEKYIEELGAYNDSSLSMEKNEKIAEDVKEKKMKKKKKSKNNESI